MVPRHYQPEKGGANEDELEQTNGKEGDASPPYEGSQKIEEKIQQHQIKGETIMIKKTQLLASILVAALVLTALPGVAVAAGSGAVNINTADAAELALLPRVGAVVSQRIIDFRQENGPFKSAEDLMLVRGIGEKTFALMEPYVSLSGDTTLQEKVKIQRPSSEEGQER